MHKMFLSLIISLGILKGFSQNVGIGTTARAFKLDVKSGSINTDSLYQRFLIGASGYANSSGKVVFGKVN